MNTNPSEAELFDRCIIYPDPDAQQRLARLVGLDSHKARLIKRLSVMVNPQGLEVWVHKYHPDAVALLATLKCRSPLVILEGDVGSGKTELAETIGDAVARQEKIDITLYPLSLSTRGQGRVGEMTRLVSAAFDLTIEAAQKLKSSSGPARGAVVLLVDEADALAQSREAGQMHHEDRAGVNAFIRGVDRLSRDGLPAAVIMCTNRLGALDPAVRRRAADVLTFERPNDEQRRAVLENALSKLRFSQRDIDALVEATGPKESRSYGFTCSDLVQRLVPAVVLDAYPDNPVRAERAIEITRSITPTPPFQEANP
jgi:AAA+ superfamily predicted ATPase